MMNRLRHDRVIVDLTEVNEEKKELYKKTKGGIYTPDDAPKEALLVKGTVVKVGHMINPQDLKEGDTVYLKKRTGERLYDDQNLYLFQEKAIIGND